MCALLIDARDVVLCIFLGCPRIYGNIKWYQLPNFLGSIPPLKKMEDPGDVFDRLQNEGYIDEKLVAPLTKIFYCMKRKDKMRYLSLFSDDVNQKADSNNGKNAPQFLEYLCFTIRYMSWRLIESTSIIQ